MANDVRAGFHLEALTLPLGNIVPTRQVTPGMRLSVKYKQIAASVAEVGVIEPLVVYPMKGAAGKYVLLDGHMRLDVLRQNGATEARCIVSLEEEGFTYNKKVNHLATIQVRIPLKANADSEGNANGIPGRRRMVFGA